MQYGRVEITAPALLLLAVIVFGALGTIGVMLGVLP